MNKAEDTFKQRKTDIVYNGKIYVRADECIRLMEHYAQQVSRENAIAFASNYIQVEKELIEPIFDKWQKQCDTCITDGLLCPQKLIFPCPYWKSNHLINQQNQQQ